MNAWPGWRRPAAAPVVLADDSSTRSLVAVIAILCFLASLAAGAAELVGTASETWNAAISREATVQLRPQGGRDADADLARAAAIAAAHPGIAAATILTRADAEVLLEPWLGRGLDLGSLPVPRLVALQLAEGGAAQLPALRARLAAEIPGSSVDDHGAWLVRLSGLADVVVGTAALLVVLVLAAAGLAVAFATRGVMMGSRDTVEVLHLVGADEAFLAREVGMRVLRLASMSAAVGAGAALLAFPIATGLLGPLLADEPDANRAAFALGLRGYVVIGLVALATAILAGIVSALSVRRFLRTDGAG